MADWKIITRVKLHDEEYFNERRVLLNDERGKWLYGNFEKHMISLTRIQLSETLPPVINQVELDKLKLKYDNERLM